MAVTRIQNNQITDSTITAAKIATGTLTGNLFASTLTLNSNVTINGNLFLSNTGNVTTINATNTYINDPLVMFNNGYSGSLSGYDIGILVNRNLASLGAYGSVNTAWVWVENDQAFEALATTDTGAGVTSINNAGFANIKVGNATITGATAITGATTFNGALTFTTATGGGLQAVAIGNVTPGTGVFTTANITNTTNNTGAGTGAFQVAGGAYIAGNLWVGGNISATSQAIAANFGSFYGNAAGFGALYTGIASGYVFQAQTVLQNSTNFNGYAQVNHQNINGGSLASGDYIVTANNGTANDTYIDMGMASSAYNYPGFGVIKPNDGYILVQGNATTGGGNLVLTSGLNDIVFAPGGSNANNEYGRITASNAFVIKSTVASTNATSGALQVAGGVGIQGATYHGGLINVAGTTNLVGATTMTTATTGGLQAAAIGNVTPGSGAFTTAAITSTTNATSITTGALTVAGGASIQQDLWIGGNIYANALNTVTTVQLQVNQPLLYLASNASPYSFDIGFYGHFVGGPANRYGHTGFVRDYNTNQWVLFSNVTSEPTANVVNLSDSNLLYDTLKSGGLILANATAASSTTTGALQVTGGAGIQGAIYAGSIQNTPIGSTTASTGAFSTLTAGGLQAAVIGNVTPGSATFTTVQTNSTFTACGAIIASSGAATTNNSTGALQVTGGTAITGNINVGGQMFIGASAQSTVLTSALAVKRGTSSSGTGVQYTQDALINATNTGSSDFIAYANNYPGPSNDHGWMDMGFTGDAFSDPVYSITKSNDGYMFASAANATVGGNLVLATDWTGNYNDVVVGVGSFYANSEVARFHGNATTNGTFVLKLPTNATGAPTANTGAFQVWGGASFGGNVYNSGATVFNGSQTAGNDMIFKGKNDATLLWARPNATYDTVIIGNSASSSQVVNGAKLNINTTDSILLPVGTNAQRPGSVGFSDTTGMLRFSSTVGAIEWYNGTTWASASTSFTVIADQQLNGTGSQTVFTLNSSQTTNSCIVSINGVLQIPTLAYSVSGTTLTFTEAPASGDVIDVRMLTTTSTVTGITSSNGYMQFQVDNAGAYVYSGTNSTAVTTSWNTAGAQVNSIANVTVASAGLATIDNLYANAYSSAKYTITATIQGTNIREIVEVLLIHNGDGTSSGTASCMVYGKVNTAGNTLATYSGATTGNIAQLQATTTNANTIFRISKNYQAI